MDKVYVSLYHLCNYSRVSERGNIIALLATHATQLPYLVQSKISINLSLIFTTRSLLSSEEDYSTFFFDEMS